MSGQHSFQYCDITDFRIIIDEYINFETGYCSTIYREFMPISLHLYISVVLYIVLDAPTLTREQTQRGITNIINMEMHAVCFWQTNYKILKQLQKKIS